MRRHRRRLGEDGIPQPVAATFSVEDVTVTEHNCEEWSPTTGEPASEEPEDPDVTMKRMLEAPDILDPEAIGDERPTRPTRELHYSPEPTHPAIAGAAQRNIGIVDKAIDEAIGTEAKHAFLEDKVKETWKEYMNAGKFNEEKRKGALTSLFGEYNYQIMAAGTRWEDPPSCDPNKEPNGICPSKKTWLHFAWMTCPKLITICRPRSSGRPRAAPPRGHRADAAPAPPPLRRRRRGDAARWRAQPTSTTTTT